MPSSIIERRTRAKQRSVSVGQRVREPDTMGTNRQRRDIGSDQRPLEAVVVDLWFYCGKRGVVVGLVDIAFFHACVLFDIPNWL